MSEVKDRVLAVRKDANMTREAFGARIGLTANSVYLMESGLRNPSSATAREICRQFSIREEWLKTGQGEMHRDLTPAMDAADRVRRLLVDQPSSTAAAVISTLVSLDPAGPEWETIRRLLESISDRLK